MAIAVSREIGYEHPCLAQQHNSWVAAQMTPLRLQAVDLVTIWSSSELEAARFSANPFLFASRPGACWSSFASVWLQFVACLCFGI
ncbi:hypothetical protein RB195_005618 [Necator americanus]|uniref:Uncharacterized protein n=1 Tax=Necator americanus TaxID=51031 RepID=A0ABR1BQL9_NECAM